jgi:hypothetical protein
VYSAGLAPDFLVRTKPFFVTGRVPLDQKICSLLFPVLFTARARVGVDVCRPVSDNTGQLLVVNDNDKNLVWLR